MEAEYVYDGYGRRVEKHVTTHITGTTVLSVPAVFAREYVFDGLDPAVEYDYANGAMTPTLVSQYVYGNGRMVLMERAEESIAESYWYHYDGLGSVVALTDESGSDVCQWKYDEYGNPLRNCPVLNHYAYTGREYDRETGMFHFFARYYDTKAGLWIAQDPYRGLYGRPKTLNRYVYVEGNPINYSDRFGYSSDDEEENYGDEIELTGNIIDIVKTIKNAPKFRTFMGTIIKYQRGVQGTRRLSSLAPLNPADILIDVTLKEAEILAQYTVGDKQGKAFTRWAAESTFYAIATPAFNVVSDVMGLELAAAGIACGPGVVVCAPAGYLAGNIGTGLLLDHASGEAVDFVFDMLDPKFEEADIWLANTVEDISSGIEQGWNYAWEAAGDAWNDAGDAWDNAWEAAGDAWDDAGDAWDNFWN